jgi:hypothetical protein
LPVSATQCRTFVPHTHWHFIGIKWLFIEKNSYNIGNEMRAFDKIATIQHYGGDSSQGNKARSSFRRHKYWEISDKAGSLLCDSQLWKTKRINLSCVLQ